MNPVTASYQPSLELAVYHLQCEGYEEEAQLVLKLMAKFESLFGAEERAAILSE
jgi:hypothetical protein